MTTCSDCGTTTEIEWGIYNGDYYCQSCYEENFSSCDDCGELSFNDDLIRVNSDLLCTDCSDECDNCSGLSSTRELSIINGNRYCDGCREEILVCEGCGCATDSDNYQDTEEGYYCNSCFQEMTGRDTINADKTIDENNTYKENTSKRYFGVEIEATGNQPIRIAELYRKEKPMTWKIEYDGSISGSGNEFISPKMRGDNAFKSIRLMCKSLQEGGFRTNKSCGVHVHFNYKGTSQATIKKLMIAYFTYENYFLLLLPKSRWNNTYCYTLKNDKVIRRILNITKPLDECWYEAKDKRRLRNYKEYKYHDSRYCSLNIHSWFYRGTIEVRSHSSTLNPEKIINWIKIHRKFFDWATKKSFKELLNQKPNVKTWKEIIGEPLTEYYYNRINQINKNNKGMLLEQPRLKTLYGGETLGAERKVLFNLIPDKK